MGLGASSCRRRTSASQPAEAVAPPTSASCAVASSESKGYSKNTGVSTEAASNLNSHINVQQAVASDAGGTGSVAKPERSTHSAGDSSVEAEIAQPEPGSVSVSRQEEKHADGVPAATAAGLGDGEATSAEPVGVGAGVEGGVASHSMMFVSSDVTAAKGDSQTREVEQMTTDDQVQEDSEATTQLVKSVEDEDWNAAADILRSARDGLSSVNLDAQTPGWGYTLMRAAAEDGATEVCRLLLALKASVNTADGNGMTPLMSAVAGGDRSELVQILLTATADVAAKTHDGFTALSWATRLRHEESVRVLRAAGAEGKDTPF